MKLRPYQIDAKREVYAAWEAGHRNVLLVLPTGSGKTVLYCDILNELRLQSTVIAHRRELVIQSATTLGAYGVWHGIIGPNEVIRDAVTMQTAQNGNSLYHGKAPCRVAGVDTLTRRGGKLSSWAAGVAMWVQDEAHHLLRENKWGKAIAMFPNARGLGVTATPERADGKGIGRNAKGVFDAMIVGPSMRDLINQGHLTEYRIVNPPNDLDLDSVPISATTGDYAAPGLKTAVRKSHIIGDVVEHYLKFAAGKLGVTFATDVETAGDMAAAYRERGVPAEVVSAHTESRNRMHILDRFRRGDIKQLVNVDIFGEGFDLPAIEVVSMARPTQSYAVYIQQFGRALRPMDGKQSALIIDHVDNVVKRHGLPDNPRVWSLEGRERRTNGKKTGTPLRVCAGCMFVYERIYKTCPGCGHTPVPAGRSRPEQVDGDLLELSPEVLAQMRRDAGDALRDPALVRAELERKRAPEIGIRAGVNRQRERIAAQMVLRDQIAVWAGYRAAGGDPHSESYRRFYHTMGIDVLSAQALGLRETLALSERLAIEVDKERVRHDHV